MTETEIDLRVSGEYLAPEIEVLCFKIEECIMTSSPVETNDNEGVVDDPNSGQW